MEIGIAGDPHASQDRVVTDREEAENPHGEWDVTYVTDSGAGDGTERTITAADADNVIPIGRGAERPATAEEEVEVERLRANFGDEL